MTVVAVALLLALAGTVAGFAQALAGTVWMWLVMAAAQLPVAVWALLGLRRQGEMRETLLPRAGDMALGVGSATLMYLLVWLARHAVVPAESVHGRWLQRAYHQVGPWQALEQSWLALGASLLVLVVTEALVWRVAALGELEKRLGTRRAWPVCALLYGASYIPSAFWLRTEAGLNPLVVAVAVVGGFVWTYLTVRTRRVAPGVISHALFLWFTVMQFRLVAS